MIHQRFKEFQFMADKLNIKFIICDESLLNWFYPSKPLLSFLNLNEPDIKKNPKIWQEKIAYEHRDSIIDKFKLLTNDSSPKKIEVPFYTIQNEIRKVILRFCPISMQKDSFYIVSLEENIVDEKYRLEAIKNRDYEIEISARIQKALLTDPYSIDNKNIEVSAETLPSNLVDGDFYDFISISPDTLDFIIGDVMGKGVPAALLAAAVKSSFFKALITHILKKQTLSLISNIIQDIDKNINEELIDLGNFLTLYYCRIDLQNYMLTFVDAGHTCIIYYSSEENRCWKIKGSNMPIGFIPNQEYKQYQLPLHKDDLIFFYSDGITEVENSESVQFGIKRLEQLIQAHHNLSTKDLIKKVLNIAFFYAAEEFKDDVTAIAVKIKDSNTNRIKEKKINYSNKEDVILEEINQSISSDLYSSIENIDEKIVTSISIAYLETLANCIKHTDNLIETCWRIYSNRCEIEILFRGPDFEWFKIIQPNIEQYQDSGFGMYLIDENVDSFLLLHGSDNIKKIILIREI